MSASKRDGRELTRVVMRAEIFGEDGGDGDSASSTWAFGSCVPENLERSDGSFPMTENLKSARAFVPVPSIGTGDRGA